MDAFDNHYASHPAYFNKEIQVEKLSNAVDNINIQSLDDDALLMYSHFIN